MPRSLCSLAHLPARSPFHGLATVLAIAASRLMSGIALVGLLKQIGQTLQRSLVTHLPHTAMCRQGIRMQVRGFRLQIRHCAERCEARRILNEKKGLEQSVSEKI